jgi:hypothetical protein
MCEEIYMGMSNFKRCVFPCFVSSLFFLFSTIVFAQNAPGNSAVGEISETAVKSQNQETSLLVWANEAAVSVYILIL